MALCSLACRLAEPSFGAVSLLLFGAVVVLLSVCTDLLISSEMYVYTGSWAQSPAPVSIAAGLGFGFWDWEWGGQLLFLVPRRHKRGRWEGGRSFCGTETVRRSNGGRLQGSPRRWESGRLQGSPRRWESGRSPARFRCKVSPRQSKVVGELETPRHSKAGGGRAGDLLPSCSISLQGQSAVCCFSSAE